MKVTLQPLNNVFQAFSILTHDLLTEIIVQNSSNTIILI
jgi:hypothetical protein